MLIIFSVNEKFVSTIFLIPNTSEYVCVIIFVAYNGHVLVILNFIVCKTGIMYFYNLIIKMFELKNLKYELPMLCIFVALKTLFSYNNKYVLLFNTDICVSAYFKATSTVHITEAKVNQVYFIL